MISRLHLLLLALSLGLLSAHAQTDNAPGRYFRVVGAGVSTNDLYFKLNGKDTNISVSDGFRSILYNGKGTGKLVFYTISHGANGKQIDTNVAEADITQAGMLALLTFSPVAENAGQYHVDVLADDLAAFPLGSYRIVNRTADPIEVRLGQQSTAVAPNDTRVVVYPKPADSTVVAAKVYTASGDTTKKLLYADTWSYNDKFRTEILVSLKPGTDPIFNVTRLLDNPTILLAQNSLPKD